MAPLIYGTRKTPSYDAKRISNKGGLKLGFRSNVAIYSQIKSVVDKLGHSRSQAWSKFVCKIPLLGARFRLDFDRSVYI